MEGPDVDAGFHSDSVTQCLTLSRKRLHIFMIETFRNKELSKLWAGTRTRIDGRLHSRIEARLDALDAATVAEDMNLPGFDYHQLVGTNPTRYTVHVNGP